MDRLKYLSTARVMEGVLVEVQDGAVAIDLKGRLGHFKMPKRMLISNSNPKVGQEVAFYMSYPEVVSEEVNQDYLENIIKQKEKLEKLK